MNYNSIEYGNFSSSGNTLNMSSRDRERDFDRNQTSHIPQSSQSYGMGQNRDLEFVPNGNSSGFQNHSGNGYYGNSFNASNSSYGGQSRYNSESLDGNGYSRMGNQQMVPGNFIPGPNINRSKNNMGLNSSSNGANEPSQQSQQYRHARRIYLGGIPPNYADEEALKSFLNNVISKGLGEDNDQTYVVSIYINQKKCFAFVELKTVELATACLDLDGIIYKKVILKVLRAKEYQPELLPPSFLSKTVRFDLTSFAFGCPATPVYNPTAVENKDYQDAKLDSLMQFSNLTAVTRGGVVVVGFPFDDSVAANRLRPMTPQGSSRNNMNNLSGPAAGSTNAPKYFRNSIHKLKYGSVDNPEYAIDLSVTKMFDVGDVLAGKNSEETKLNLTATVTELVARGGIPFVVGGSADQCYYNALGLIAGCNSSNVGVLCISAQLDSRLLDDPKFCQPKAGSLSCDGRYIRFAAQGSQCTSETAQYIGDRGGQIVWYGKHLRNPAAKYSAAYHFKKVLANLCTNASGSPRPVYVSLDVGAICASAIPQAASSNSPIGLAVDEVLDMAMIAGANPNVILFDVVEFVPSTEDVRHNLLLAEIYYKFVLGVASRAYIQLPDSGSTTNGSNYPTSTLASAATTQMDDSPTALASANNKLENGKVGASSASLGKLSLKPLSSSAPEFSPPTLSIDPFMQPGGGGSGKHHAGIVGSRFGQQSHQLQFQQQYGGFSASLGGMGDSTSNSNHNNGDLVGSSGELAGSPYSSYFEGAQQALDVNTGGGFFGGMHSTRHSHSSSKPESSSFMSNTFNLTTNNANNNNTGIPSPTSFSAPGSTKSGMMLYSSFSMMDQSSSSNGSSLGLGLMGSNFVDNIHHSPLQLQYSGTNVTDSPRYAPPGITLPDSSMSGSSDAASPISFTGQNVVNTINNNITNNNNNNNLINSTSSINRDEVQGNLNLEKD